MSPVEREVVRRKIAVIIENLNALKTVKEMSIEEYKSDIFKRKASERMLQELIDAAVDINTHLIVQAGNPVPDDYYESFIKTGELKIISPELASSLAPSAGLRNRLVHEYDALDHSIVLKAVSLAENLYPRYIRSIENYITDLP